MVSKVDTRDHNLDILQSLGYKKFKNTTIFQNGENFILSPAVSENSNGKYWFDIREVNLNRINEKSFLLVRVVPDIFILERINSISSLLDISKMDNRPNSGNVWGLKIYLINSLNKAVLYNLKDTTKKIETHLFRKGEIIDAFYKNQTK